MNSTHANDPQTVVLRKQRPPLAKPTRPNITKLEESDEIKTPETVKLDISTRVSQARVARGYKTRKDLASALSMNVEVINCIENRKPNYDKQKLNIICQKLRIKPT